LATGSLEKTKATELSRLGCDLRDFSELPLSCLSILSNRSRCISTSFLSLVAFSPRPGPLPNWFRLCHPAEGDTIVRLLTGELRAGAKEGLYEAAVSKTPIARISSRVVKVEPTTVF